MVEPGVIDLRSDTVTRPTTAMRRAMAEAEVGDDVYGEDPTVRRLEERTAELVGKDAALFVPSGTMANQIALLLHSRRGDLVYAAEGTHTWAFESGAGAALAGVQFEKVGHGGPFSAAELDAVMHAPRIVEPRPALVVVENTHGASGGRVSRSGDVSAVVAVARAHGLRAHLDGARLWNAAAESSESESLLAAPFDTVSVCFSKGLGAPVGSAVLVPRALEGDARRYRKMLGGGMRQAGILAAGALHALEHHRGRLAQDHEHARVIARRLAGLPGVLVKPEAVETNIVNVELEREEAVAVAARLGERGVLVHAMSPRKIRVVTHLDVSRDQALAAAEIFAQLLET